MYFTTFYLCFLSLGGSKPSKRRWFLNSNLVLRHHSWRASSWTTYDPWLTSGQWSPAQEGLQLVCYFKHEPISEQHNLRRVQPDSFHHNVFYIYIFIYIYLVPTPETRQHSSGLLAYSYSCVSKVKSRSVWKWHKGSFRDIFGSRKSRSYI